VRRLSPRDRVLLFSSVAMLVVLALLFGVTLPMNDRMGKAAGEVSKLRRELAEAAAMYQQSPALRQEIGKLRSTATELSRPDADVGPDMIREIDRMAKDLGLTLINVRPAQPEAEGDCGKYAATFEVQSDYARLMRLLWELEQPPHPLWVEGVQISSERGGPGEMRTRISVAVYTLKPPSERT